MRIRTNKRTFIVTAVASLLLAIIQSPTSRAASTSPIVYTATMPKAHIPSAPNGGTDDYRCFLIDPSVKQDSLITSVKFLPQRKVLWHHSILFLVAANGSRANLMDYRFRGLHQQQENGRSTNQGNPGLAGTHEGLRRRLFHQRQKLH